MEHFRNSFSSLRRAATDHVDIEPDSTSPPRRTGSMRQRLSRAVSKAKNGLEKMMGKKGKGGSRGGHGNNGQQVSPNPDRPYTPPSRQPGPPFPGQSTLAAPGAARPTTAPAAAAPAASATPPAPAIPAAPVRAPSVHTVASVSAGSTAPASIRTPSVSTITSIPRADDPFAPTGVVTGIGSANEDKKERWGYRIQKQEWYPGRVIGIADHQAAPQFLKTRDNVVSTPWGDVESKFRKFVILELKKHHVIALPIYTFSGRGLQKYHDPAEFFPIRDDEEQIRLGPVQAPQRDPSTLWVIPDVRFEESDVYMMRSHRKGYLHFMGPKNIPYAVHSACFGKLTLSSFQTLVEAWKSFTASSTYDTSKLQPEVVQKEQRDQRAALKKKAADKAKADREKNDQGIRDRNLREQQQATKDAALKDAINAVPDYEQEQKEKEAAARAARRLEKRVPGGPNRTNSGTSGGSGGSRQSGKKKK